MERRITFRKMHSAEPLKRHGHVRTRQEKPLAMSSSEPEQETVRPEIEDGPKIVDSRILENHPGIRRVRSRRMQPMSTPDEELINNLAADMAGVRVTTDGDRPVGIQPYSAEQAPASSAVQPIHSEWFTPWGSSIQDGQSESDSSCDADYVMSEESKPSSEADSLDGLPIYSDVSAPDIQFNGIAVTDIPDDSALSLSGDDSFDSDFDSNYTMQYSSTATEDGSSETTSVPFHNKRRLAVIHYANNPNGVVIEWFPLYDALYIQDNRFPIKPDRDDSSESTAPALDDTEHYSDKENECR